MSQTKVKSGLLNFPDQTDFVKLPSGTTAQRPSSPEEGYSRYNTTDDKLEYWNGTVWQQLPALDPPTLTSVDYPGNDLAADPAGGQTILINGTNFSAGISVEIGSTQVSSVTLNSTIQLAITSPALTAGDYDVTVTNLDDTTITALDFISYNGVPSWVTASGSLGSLNFGEAISTISLSATEPDGGNVSYAVTSGALPSGLTLSSSGDITGTMPSGSAETTYTFTVTATDDENQSTDRSFTITGVVPFVPSQHFNTVLYTGNGSGNRAITGVGFQPDLVWIKNRDTTNAHALVNSVAGSNYIQYSNSSSAGETNANIVTSLNSDGFTVGSEPTSNGSGQDLVAWCWKAGGASVSNTDGTITSQVSANTEAGFSIVTFTGNGTTASVGHGLGQKPSIIFTKNRSVSEDWFTQQYMYVPSGNAAFGYLNTTAAFTGFTDSLTDDTVIQQGGTNGQNYVSYCFAEVEGFSSFGSYTGADNNIIHTGFEPAFIMTKSTTNSAGGWTILDNKRGSINRLYPHLSNSEGTDASPIVTFLANGFSLNTRDSWNNGSHNYIYMAFAADPNTQVPTKADSFNTVIYSGNNGTQTISGVGFKTDLTITKTRVGAAYDHRVIDSVRGLKKDLYLNLTTIENNYSPDTYGYIQNISSTGYQVVDGTAIQDAYNQSGVDYVAWNWKAGGTPYINTDGSITSVVSANPAAGFSIVSYTGNGSVGATVGHGLGAEPNMIIVKARSGISGNWVVYDSVNGGTNYMLLNGTTASATDSTPWNNTNPTNTNFTLGISSNTNSANPFIAYCFSEVAGFSKISSYTGNGSTQSINVGFAPAFVMFKRADSTGEWTMIDNKRNNGDNWLYANLLNAEGVNINRTTLNSTGFDLDGSPSSCNESGSTYIYIAFANQF